MRAGGSQDRGAVGEMQKMLYGKDGPPKLPASARIQRASSAVVAVAFAAAIVFAIALGCFELFKVVVH